MEYASSSLAYPTKNIMYMAKYFTVSELTKSSTADKLGIDNTPTDETIQNNIIELMDFLDGVREGWTKECKDKGYGDPAIVVNSGYRSEALNKAVKGSKTSEHLLGTAADIVPKNGRNKEFFEWLKTYVADKNFSQLINEYPDKEGRPSWVHLGIKGRNEHPYRCQVLTIK